MRRTRGMRRAPPDSPQSRRFSAGVGSARFPF